MWELDLSFYCKRNAPFGWTDRQMDGLVPGGACPWHWHGHSVSFLDHPSISSFPKSLVSNQSPPAALRDRTELGKPVSQR